MMLRWMQYRASLKKNWLNKRRNLRVTLYEMLSPLFMMWLLYYGYQQSEIWYIEARNYAQINFSSNTILSLFDGSIEGDGWYTEAAESTGNTALESVRALLDQVLKGPLPAPGFDEFVLASSTISTYIDEELYNELLGQTQFGQAFGNLITLGTVHVAPAGPTADAFDAFMRNSSSTWRRAQYDVLNRNESSSSSSTSREEPFFRVRVHETENKAVNWIDKHANDERAWVLIVFDEMEPGRVDYTLRFNYTTVPHTKYLVNWIAIGLDERYQRYYLSGFYSVAHAVDAFAFNYTGVRSRTASLPSGEDGDDAWGPFSQDTSASHNGAECKPPVFIGTPFPTAPYEQNLFYIGVGYLLGLALTMATLYPVSRLIKDLVEEKETRMRETMAAMGISLTVNALAWFTSALILFTWLAGMMTWIARNSFIPRSDVWVIFLYFWLLLVSEIALSFLVSACFSRARLASIVGPVALFATVLPRYIFFGSNRYENSRGKIGASLLSVSAFCFGADIIADYEYAEVGVSWANSAEGDYSLNTCLMMMAFDTILYFVLAAYLEAVLPTQHGSPRHWAFPLIFVYDRLVRRETGSDQLVVDRAIDATSLGTVNTPGQPKISPIVLTDGDSSEAGLEQVVGAEELREGQGTDMEDTGTFIDNGMIDSVPVVRILDLVKEYHGAVWSRRSILARAVSWARIWLAKIGIGDPSKVRQYKGPKRAPAVDRLRLDFYEGQVTCLLGHNGAGKSTTISMMTGLTPPTSGDALVYGQSIVSHLDDVRRSLGVCPQTNVLFPSLTVQEHLEFFASIKGLHGRERQEAIEHIISEVGLTEKRDVFARALSGGMKRKLCLAMALIGSPRVLYLDEPTSGMDPYSRRATWDLIRRAKKGRVVVLTTHFMDEADILGDRIAIMSRGRVKCVGTSLWLKARYGVGYNLTVVKQTNQMDGEGKSKHDIELNRKKKKHLNLSTDIDVGPSSGESNELSSAILRTLDSPNLLGGNLEPTLSENNGINDAGSVESLILSLVPSAEVLSSVAREITFRLPRESSGVFPKLFAALEGRRDLGVGEEREATSQQRITPETQRELIDAFGVSVTTLEEVFIRIAREDEKSLLRRQNDRQHGIERSHGDSTTTDYDSDEDDNDMEATCLLDPLPRQRRLWWQRRAEENTPSFKGKVYATREGNIGSTRAEANIEMTAVVSTLPSVEAQQIKRPSLPGSQSKKTGTFEVRDVNFTEELAIQYTKRWVVFKRDQKGACFQLLVPLLLIIAILSILTIDIEPAGPSLRAHPNEYSQFSGQRGGKHKVRSEVTLIGNERPFCEGLLGSLRSDAQSTKPKTSWIQDVLLPISGLSQTAEVGGGHVRFEEIGASSYNLSEFWLNNFGTSVMGSKERLGAFVCRDEIPTTLDIDWDSLFEILPDLLRAGARTGADELIEEAVNSNKPYVITAQPYKFAVTMAEMERICNAGVEVIGGENNADDAIIEAEELQCDELSEVSTPEEMETWLNATISGRWMGSALNDLATALNVSSVGEFLETSGLLTFNASASPDTSASVIVDIPETTLNFNHFAISDSGNKLTFIEMTLTFDTNGTDTNFKYALRNSDNQVYATPNSTSVTVVLGNVTMTDEQFIDILKGLGFKGVKTYQFKTSADFTILHNASSWHALYLFHGYAREQAYADRCLVHPDGAADNDAWATNDDIIYRGFYDGPSSRQGSRAAQQSFKYTVRNHPLPLTTRQTLEIRYILSIISSIFILIALCYVPAAFVTFVVKERFVKSKHLQLVSGGNVNVYWIATYLWDSTVFLGLAVAIMLVFASYGRNAAAIFLTPFDAAIATFLLLVTFGASTIPYNYCATFFFTNHVTAQISILMINFTTGFVASMAYLIMSAIESTQDLAEDLRIIFLCFPPYNFGEGLLRLSSSFYSRVILGVSVEIFSWDIVGCSLTFMTVEALVYFLVTLCLETPAAKRFSHWIDQQRVASFFATLQRGQSEYQTAGGTFKHSNSSDETSQDTSGLVTEDVDIAGEERVVQSIMEKKYRNPGSGEATEEIDGRGASWSNAIILLQNLQKVYPPSLFQNIWCLKYLKSFRRFCCGCGGPNGNAEKSTSTFKHAVRGVSLAVPEGEIFGFLGINGAGKSTTLGILTGHLMRSRGVALVNGRDAAEPAAQRSIGYCPQEDPLLEHMTGQETLEFFGRLKGLHRRGGKDAEADTMEEGGNTLKAAVKDTLRRVGLTKFRHQPCGGYSGGMKRKLSFAVALIGEPPVLLLDEPSTGMDPVARRNMWDSISAAAPGRSIVLTTHSMEECEALCSRVGIMVGGTFRCLGTTQHLKDRFCSAYKVEVRCKSGCTPAPNPGVVQEECTVHSGGLGEGEDDSGSKGGIDGSGAMNSFSVERVTIEDKFASVPYIERAKAFIARLFPSARLDEQHGTFARFEVASSNITLSEAFAAIEKEKEILGIEDYSVSQGSLEQVFIRFAKTQDEEAGHIAGLAYDGSPLEGSTYGREIGLSTEAIL